MSRHRRSRHRRAPLFETLEARQLLHHGPATAPHAAVLSFSLAAAERAAPGSEALAVHREWAALLAGREAGLVDRSTFRSEGAALRTEWRMLRHERAAAGSAPNPPAGSAEPGAPASSVAAPAGPAATAAPGPQGPALMADAGSYTVTIQATDRTTEEGSSSPAVLTVTADPAPTSGQLYVTYTYTSTGTLGTDFTMPGAAAVTLSSSSPTATIPVSALEDDSSAERLWSNDVTVTLTGVTLSSGSGSGSGSGGGSYTLASPSSATVSIRDDDIGSTPQVNSLCPTCDPILFPSSPAANANDPGSRAVSASGIDVSTGATKGIDPGLTSSGFGETFGPSLAWSNVSGLSDNSPYGIGWVDSSRPSLQQTSNGGIMAVASGTSAVWFVPGTQSGTYVAEFYEGTEYTLQPDGSSGDFLLTDAQGDQVRFYGFESGLPADQQGQLESFTDPAGNAITTSYNAAGQLTEAQRSSTTNGATTTESFLYTYIASGSVNAGLVQGVALQRQVGSGNPIPIRKAVFTYYDGTQPDGNAGDLEMEQIEDGNGTPLDTSYYRYYLPGDANGYTDGLEYYFSPESYARLAQAMSQMGLDPLTATDAQVSSYADDYYQYDGQQRVTLETTQGAGATGHATYTYKYVTPSGGANPAGYNSWQTQTIETLPDGNTNTYYSNSAGEVMLTDFHDATDPSLQGKDWITLDRYDSQGRLVEEAQPSAFIAYDGSNYDASAADLMDFDNGTSPYLSNSSGAIDTYDYGQSTTATATTPGDVTGYAKDEQVQVGQAGTPVLLSGEQYIAHADNNGVTVYPQATSAAYRNADGTGAETTTDSYSWYAGTNEIQSDTTTAPVGASAVPVDLSASYNRTGIYVDGTSYPGNGGIDGGGTAYSASLLTSPVAWDGQAFGLGPAGSLDDLAAAGQTIALPPGAYSQLLILGTGVNGDQVAEPFTVQYADGTSSSFSQSLSDWHTPQGYAGESIVSTMPYRDTAAGGEQPLTFDLYGYAEALDPGKSVVGITLPNDGDVVILAMDLVPATAAVSDTSTVVYDTYGRPTWTRDGDGYIDYTAYDNATGAVVTSIVDVNTADTSEFSGLPAGWTTPAGGGLNLVTQTQVDGLGRPTEVTDPNGNVTYYVYDDPNHEVRVYPGWNTSTGMPTGPTIVYREDMAGSYFETLTMSATPHLTGGVPDGTEPIANIQSLERDDTDTAGRTIEVDQYFNLSGLTYSTAAHLGTAYTFGGTGGNYDATYYGYDNSGNLQRVQDANGTITETLYDGLDRPTAVYVGTNDGTTNGQPWSPADASTASNMIRVEQDLYDNNGVGDGNLTQVTLYADSNANDNRVTQYAYDGRDRLVATKSGVQATEDTTTYRPIVYDTLDNLGEVTAIAQYDGDGVTLTNSPPAASLLRADETFSYDDQGRVYRTQQYDVNQATGALSASALTTNLYYDHRGDPIAEADPGGLWTKDQYDGAGRLVSEALTDGGGGSSWAAAGSLAGDQVLTQTLTTYDADGNPILVADKQRFSTDTASQTGPLGDPATGPRARVYYTAAYYDAAGRATATVDVGTNGGTAYTRPATAPAPSDTALVTSYAYDAAGDVQSTTDPRGVVTADSHDALGRVTQEILAYTDGTPTASTDQTTNYTYDGIGDVTSVQVMMPAGTPSQTTQYVYGVTTAGGGGIDSNDLLATVEQPDPTTGAPSTAASNQENYTYDALGDILTATDPNGTTHAYAYDVLGRQTSDAVTHLGAGVDGSVLRHTTAYDALGLPDLYTSYDAASGGSIVNQVEDVYNGLGQLTGEYQEQAGAVNTATSPEVQYAYTEMAGGQDNSRLTRMVYPNGRTLDYVYNPGLDSSISRLGAIADDSGGSPGTILEGYTYLGLGTIVQYAHPQDGVNLTDIQPGSTGDGGDQYVGLDRFGRVVDQNWVNGSGVSTDRFQYAYDRSGDVLSSNNLVNPAESELYQANGAASNSAYDPLGRETAFARGTLSASVGGGPLDTITSPSASQSWSLDALGNWAGVTTNGSTTTQTFNAQDQTTQVSGGTAPGYDPNGDTISDAGLTVVYNAWDQPVAVQNGGTTVAAYAYDALGRRIAETYGGTVNHLYYSPRWQVIEERQGGTGTSNVTDQYVWGAGGIDQLVLRDAYGGGVPGQRLYAQWNADGGVTALVNTSGQVVERYLYTPYGSVTVTDANWNPLAGNTSAYDWRYLFQGGRLDTATGWYDFRNRDLIPAEGRWAERDPLGLAAGDPNEYRFVGDDPASTTDPSGLIDWGGWAQWGWDVGSAGAMGVVQGGANTINGIQDGAIGLANLPATAYNNTAGRLGGGTIGYIPSPDWSRGLVTAESDASHEASKFLGGTGATILISAPSAVRSVAGKAAGLAGIGRTGGAARTGSAAAKAASKLERPPSCPRPNCFPPDTPVATEAGPRPIARVEAGDRVWAYDFRAGVWRLCVVDARHDSVYDGPLVTIETEAGVATATAYHPFWAIEGRDLEARDAPRDVDANEDRGGSLPGRWVNSHDLREGDAVFLQGVGPAIVRRIHQRVERTPVCNLTVRDLHSFAAGDARALVHNTSGTGGAPSTPSLDPNRLNHVFGKAEHALDSLVAKYGSQEGAYKAVQDAANKALAEGKLIPGRNGVLPSGDAGPIIDVGGMPVRLIGGRAKDGAVQISSFSRKGL